MTAPTTPTKGRNRTAHGRRPPDGGRARAASVARAFRLKLVVR